MPGFEEDAERFRQRYRGARIAEGLVAEGLDKLEAFDPETGEEIAALWPGSFAVRMGAEAKFFARRGAAERT